MAKKQEFMVEHSEIKHLLSEMIESEEGKSSEHLLNKVKALFRIKETEVSYQKFNFKRNKKYAKNLLLFHIHFDISRNHLHQALCNITKF